MAQGNAGKGRAKGSVNKRTAEMLAQVEATGDTPLAYMIGVLQDESSPADARKWAAEKAAPYIHAKPLPQARTITLELPDTATPLGHSRSDWSRPSGHRTRRNRSL